MIIAVLDERHIQTPRLTAAQEFSALAGLIRMLRNDQICVKRRGDIWSIEIWQGVALYNLLFEVEVGYLDEDIRQTLWLAIDALQQWDESNDDSRSSFEFVCDEIKNGSAVCCLVLPSQDGRAAFGQQRIHLIGREEHLIEFYRDAPELADFSEAEFIENAARAFPKLHLHPDLEKQISRFTVSFRPSHRAQLTAALGSLNDYLPPLVGQHTDNHQISKIFQSRSSFEISPESSNTHKNKKAMAERDVWFGQEKVRCEWHLKLRPERDRIHFFFGRQSVSNKPILIGIFCDHLQT